MAGSACSFLAIVGDHCGHDSKDRSKSEDCLPILSCDCDILSHKSAFSIVGIENEVELLLARVSIFSLPRNIEKWTVCPRHRSTLGVGWKRSSVKCSVPVSLSDHSENSAKKPKAERGLSKTGSKTILKETGIFVPVGAGESLFTCLLVMYFYHISIYMIN